MIFIMLDLRNKIIEKIRNKRIKRLRQRLNNNNPTIIANNCNGTFIYKDLGLKFNSPTINLFFSIEDFIKFLENMDNYLKSELREDLDSGRDYPVGILDDIKINFMHYKTFNEAKEKWYERIDRINMNNLYIIMNEGRGSNYQLLERFNKLPYAHKIMFTHVPYPEFESAFYIKGYEDKDTCDFLFNYMKPGIKRYYEQFDYVSFLNS